MSKKRAIVDSKARKTAAEVQEINTLLATLNALLFADNPRLGLAFVEYASLREQDVNANVMPSEMFAALTSNIGKHGSLESIPLCATREGSDVIEIVSGHHRIRAAKAAGHTQGVVLVYRGLTADEIRAKQLSHNSIAGSSDAQLVAEIFSQIGSVDAQLEAFIDPNLLDTVPEPVPVELVDVDPFAGTKVVTMLFLPTQLEMLEVLFDLIPAETDKLYLARRADFDRFREAVAAVRTGLEIRAVPTAVAHMAEIVLEHMHALGEDGEEQ